jgi:hypothetical protein
MQLTIFYYAPQRWYDWSCGVRLPMLVAVIVFMAAWKRSSALDQARNPVAKLAATTTTTWTSMLPENNLLFAVSYFDTFREIV